MFPKVDFLGTPTDTYSLCILYGALLVFILVLALKPKEFPFRYVFGGVVVFFLAAIIGSNLWNIIIHYPHPSSWSIHQIFINSGAAYLGIPVFGFSALWIYCRLIKIPFLAVSDYVAPFVMLQLFTVRIGCLAYGCCYGIPSSLPWAYTFHTWGITNVVPRHPTQAYEMIYSLAILISSCYLYRKTKDIRAIPKPEGWEKRSLEERKALIRQAPSAGIVFFYIFFWYGLLRSFNELLRAEGPFIYGPFKISHIVLAGFVIASVTGLSVIIKKSAAKDKMIKALKGASLRLLVWLVLSGIVILYAISLHVH